MAHLFSSKASKKKAFLAILVIITIIILTIIVTLPLAKAFSNPAQIKTFVLQFGAYSAIVFILIQILQLIFAIIPSPPVVIAGGYIFGPFLGTMYSLIGLLIGSTIVFGITRLFGRPFVENILDKSILEKIDEKSNSFAKTLFVLYLVPIMPHDAFTYLAGLTNMKFKKFLLAVATGRLPSILFLSVVGYQLTKLSLLFSLILLGFVIVGGVLIFYKRKNIEDNLHKHINKIEERIKRK